jgi:hypothetical protein
MMEAASTSEKTVADYMAQHPKRVIFIFWVPHRTHKLEVTPKLWVSTTEIGKIPAGETEVS